MTEIPVLYDLMIAAGGDPAPNIPLILFVSLCLLAFGILAVTIFYQTGAAP